LPAAATTIAPRWSTDVTASRNVWENEVPPRLRLTTRAPWSTAQTMPFEIGEYGPLPLASSTFTGTSEESNASPATPTALFVAAAAMPATWVPWPLSSIAAPVAQPEEERQLPPRSVRTRPSARSGCVESTPVSTTAMRTPLPVAYAPGYTPHPAVAWTFERFHWFERDGSFGSEIAACAMKFGSAYRTPGSSR
jgi:hypothetical protein